MTWQVFPDTAPKDRDILVRGMFRISREECVVIGRWSSIMSDGISGYRWYASFLQPFDSIDVDFFEWMDIPK